jgi:hypothetical protein
MGDPLKYFRLGFVGERVKEPNIDYEAGVQAYVEVTTAVNRMSIQYIKGFKDGCHQVRRYEGDTIYDDGYAAGKKAFHTVCEERRTFLGLND